MKIGHPADKPLPVPATGAQAAAAEVGKPASGAATQAATAVAAGADASAKVNLSSTASTLLSGGTSTEFNADKVAQMSASIAAGTFKVNPEAIADKLIANAQELLTKVKG